jgi:hypothetical protein
MEQFIIKIGILLDDSILLIHSSAWVTQGLNLQLLRKLLIEKRRTY